MWHAYSIARVKPRVLACALAMVALIGCADTQTANDNGVPVTSVNTAAQVPSADQPSLETSSLAASTAPQIPTTTREVNAVAETATTGLAALSTLPVKPRGDKTGYTRDQFGQAWTDDVPVADGHNGCSTREDILRRDLSAVVMMSTTDTCTVLSGTLNDQYTATAIPFIDGASSPIDIDHLVSLSDAWQSGANVLTEDQRQSLANDPLNLQAVSSTANRQKGDGDTATWLPPNRPYRCEYVQRQIEVKVKYGLWVKPAELDAMQRVLTGCGGVAPASTGAVSTTREVPVPDDQTPPVATDPTDPATPATADGSDYFANCAAVRAAGRAPLLRGEPGYRAEMDGDGDGVACEVPH